MFVVVVVYHVTIVAIGHGLLLLLIVGIICFFFSDRISLHRGRHFDESQHVADALGENKVCKIQH